VTDSFASTKEAGKLVESGDQKAAAHLARQFEGGGCSPLEKEF
jgi:hypothetical protein